MVLQAYDFVELFRREGCRLQMGGSDQWGNIVNGIELGRRTNGVELYGLTTALLTTASGAKMGKTAAGAVWLNPDMLTPYDYWQYWRNTEDADVERFLKLFTEVPLPEIAKLAALKGAELNEAKKVLATEATALLHGREAADRAEGTAKATFEQGTLAPSLPTFELRRAELDKGLGRIDRQHPCRLCRLDQRSAASNQGRRSQSKRRCRHRREAASDARRPHARRRHQAIARQEAARADPSGVKIAFSGRCRRRRNRNR